MNHAPQLFFKAEYCLKNPPSSPFAKGGYSTHPLLNRALLIQKINDSIALRQ